MQAGPKSGKKKGGHKALMRSEAFGDDVQVTYAITDHNDGNGMKDVPDMIVQLRFPGGKPPATAQLGGPLMQQMPKDMAEKMMTIYGGFADAVTPAKLATEWNAGDVVSTQDFGATLRAFLGAADLAPGANAMQTRGPGIQGRLTGRTTRNGRDCLVVTIDGYQEFGWQDAAFRAVAAGYHLVDEATGLYAERHLVSYLSGTLTTPEGDKLAFSLQNSQRAQTKF